MKSFDLKGKVAIVTGGNGGIDTKLTSAFLVDGGFSIMG